MRSAMIDTQVEYRGVLGIAQNFTPSKSLEEYLRAMIPLVKQDIPQMELIIDDCLRIVKSKLQNPKGLPVQLTPCQLLAIVIFTHDLGLLATCKKENFYFQFTEMLRRRADTEMTIWQPYLYFFIEALKKLPAVGDAAESQLITLYRGTSETSLILQEYTKMRSIHWSAFSSATPDLAVAQGFAGPNGIVMSIAGTSGRDISSYSAIPQEMEVLLKPNINLIVIEAASPNKDDPSDKRLYIKMMEIHREDQFTW